MLTVAHLITHNLRHKLRVIMVGHCRTLPTRNWDGHFPVYEKVEEPAVARRAPAWIAIP